MKITAVEVLPIDDLLARCVEAKERGFTAIGHPFAAMGLVAQQIAIPLATGERLHTIQEYSHTEHEPPKRELVEQTMRCEGGFLIVPDAPGIGIEPAPDAREKYPPVLRNVGTRLHVDGSVVDQ